MNQGEEFYSEVNLIAKGTNEIIENPDKLKNSIDNSISELLDMIECSFYDFVEDVEDGEIDRLKEDIQNMLTYAVVLYMKTREEQSE